MKIKLDLASVDVSADPGTADSLRSIETKIKVGEASMDYFSSSRLVFVYQSIAIRSKIVKIACT